MFLLLTILSGAVSAPQTDTLQTAVICAGKGICVSREDTLSTSGICSITELLLQSPGVTICDYGGWSGSKSANLRGLGSPHTTIYLDGIKVNNLQSGQPDLGMLPLDNCSGAIIDYARNSIDFHTARPAFNGKTLAGRIKFAGGSFGTFLPQANLDWKIGENLAMRASASGICSRGYRSNDDIMQARAGLDFFGTISGGDWMAKAAYNGSKRGVPGPVSYPSGDRQTDRNVLAQATLCKQFNPLYSLSASAKTSFDRKLYRGEWENGDYNQVEVQVNSAHRFRLKEWLDISAAAFYQWDGFHAGLYDTSRSDVSISAGASFNLRRFKADIAAQYEGFFDKGEAGRNVFSPSADIRFSAFKGFDITGFVRRAYRMPTFDELYYPGYGNPGLKPEDAVLSDVGIDYRCMPGRFWTLKVKWDAFYNYLNNKIISAPEVDDPNIWKPYNIAKVHSAGTDVMAGAEFKYARWEAGADVRYSYQSADDIPYMAKHSLTLGGMASWRGWSLQCTWNWRAGRSDSNGPMSDWNTLDASFGKAIGLRGCGPLTFKLICRNLTDCRYELVSGYPACGRAFLGEVDFNF